MKTVGIRELKDRLSEYVRRARQGESVLVTDRGEPVARLCPPDPTDAEHAHLPPGWIDLARRGKMRLPLKAHRPGDRTAHPRMPRALSKGVSALDLLDQDRGER